MLRDRDAIVTGEGLIFRVFGYLHPPAASICDIEYAPATIFKSENPKAFRNQGPNVFYKFYEDEGWKFIQNKFPRYMIYHDMLQKKVVGVHHNFIQEIRKPEEELKRLVQTGPKDSLQSSMHNVLNIVTNQSGLSTETFGVFGSMLHGFHNPANSDIDLIVYGKENINRLRSMLQESYDADSSPLHNEFDTEESIRGKVWRFQNFTATEFLKHQQRKTIYALYDSGETGRTVKTEFEPVKNWKEVRDEYDPTQRIVQRGWVKMLARVKDDGDAPFIPSIYGIEPLKILEGHRNASEAVRIVSYMEEFRLQAFNDETVYVEGNLEEVTSETGSFFQVALTYCPRYYGQVLKATKT